MDAGATVGSGISTPSARRQLPLTVEQRDAIWRDLFQNLMEFVFPSHLRHSRHSAARLYAWATHGPAICPPVMATTSGDHVTWKGAPVKTPTPILHSNAATMASTTTPTPARRVTTITTTSSSRSQSQPPPLAGRKPGSQPPAVPQLTLQGSGVGHAPLLPFELNLLVQSFADHFLVDVYNANSAHLQRDSAPRSFRKEGEEPPWLSKQHISSVWRTCVRESLDALDYSVAEVTQLALKVRPRGASPSKPALVTSNLATPLSATSTQRVEEVAPDPPNFNATNASSQSSLARDATGLTAAPKVRPSVVVLPTTASTTAPPITGGTSHGGGAPKEVTVVGALTNVADILLVNSSACSGGSTPTSHTGGPESYFFAVQAAPSPLSATQAQLAQWRRERETMFTRLSSEILAERSRRMHLLRSAVVRKQELHTDPLLGDGFKQLVIYKRPVVRPYAIQSFDQASDVLKLLHRSAFLVMPHVPRAKPQAQGQGQGQGPLSLPPDTGVEVLHPTSTTKQAKVKASDVLQNVKLVIR